ncbi:hypothetical protein WICPIJ_004828 [Wickerhamomyces pijperi]|uniref:Uncharacterized protein n=1 Tax=Wickerhamomyces pijperi TaxID=599730 RepID=A0A9P8TMI3_WICPI|nr:hypothetical protein WICPIJ_004828 [Wickerhamomyces pijperi]
MPIDSTNLDSSPSVNKAFIWRKKCSGSTNPCLIGRLENLFLIKSMISEKRGMILQTDFPVNSGSFRPKRFLETDSFIERTLKSCVEMRKTPAMYGREWILNLTLESISSITFDATAHGIPNSVS